MYEFGARAGLIVQDIVQSPLSLGVTGRHFLKTALSAGETEIGDLLDALVDFSYLLLRRVRCAYDLSRCRRSIRHTTNRSLNLLVPILSLFLPKVCALGHLACTVIEVHAHLHDSGGWRKGLFHERRNVFEFHFYSVVAAVFDFALFR